MANERSCLGVSTTSSLLESLKCVLPRGIPFDIHHLSTPPTRSPALYSPAPGKQPERTYCTSHFLTIGIQVKSSELKNDHVLVFAIEVLIYSTLSCTTFFVSKADSTGYLHLLNLPKSRSSPIRGISTVFLRHLVHQHSRHGVKTVLSLFARAQDQYLFPGSVENEGKHVLDDRQLVRWWCKVLDPLLPTQTQVASTDLRWDRVHGYLTIPGLDSYETRAFIPAHARAEGSTWTMGHPLSKMSLSAATVPPRCLIPRFPDDPKARFLDELDDEISKSVDESNGQWKSVRSIDQFWDMMAYRQECSAGRLVGFIWLLYTPKSLQNPAVSKKITVTSSNGGGSLSINHAIQNSLPTPQTSSAASSQSTSDQAIPMDQSRVAAPKTRKPRLRGPIKPRQPRIKRHVQSASLRRPETTPYYTWPKDSRGQVVVEAADYKKNTELLLRLDFASLTLAMSSSKRWIDEVRLSVPGDASPWGQIITGTREAETKASSTGAPLTSPTAGVNMLTGLVRKKKKEIPSTS